MEDEDARDGSRPTKATSRVDAAQGQRAWDF
jgi:hypothetical protein